MTIWNWKDENLGLVPVNCKSSFPISQKAKYCALLEESLLLTKDYWAVRQNVSWLIQSSVTTKYCAFFVSDWPDVPPDGGGADGGGWPLPWLQWGGTGAWGLLVTRETRECLVISQNIQSYLYVRTQRIYLYISRGIDSNPATGAKGEVECITWIVNSESQGELICEIKVVFAVALLVARVVLTGQKCFKFYAHKILCIIYRIRNSGAIFRGSCYR